MLSLGKLLTFANLIARDASCWGDAAAAAAFAAGSKYKHTIYQSHRDLVSGLAADQRGGVGSSRSLF